MCLLSKKMRCCEYNPAEKGLKECLFRAADWCGFHQSTATGAQKKTSQNLPMLSSVTFYCEKLSKLSTSVKFVEKIVKLVKKYVYIPSNMFRKQRVAQYWAVCTSVDSAWANIKDYSSSTLSLVTGPRGSVKRVWKSIWWWKSESGLMKYENSIWLRV